MKTYFIRHGSALDLDDATIELLRTGNYIAIHYPTDKNGNFEAGDSTSLDPNDYDGRGKSSLKKLHEIASNGGYVFSVYRGCEGAKLGFVKPGSKVKIFKGLWGRKGAYSGREAVIKVIQLDRSKELSATESISFKSVQPRQGTICHWRKVGSRVRSKLEGYVEKNVGSLTPDLQEVMCMEFLRSGAADRYNLPKLIHTLAPVGRTLKDIDILGVSEDNRIISAQVTYHDLSNSAWKLSKLDAYNEEDNYTVYFCKCAQPSMVNGHIVFPIDLVFKEFCENDKHGTLWFNQVTGI
ncbi:hypothetical protein VH1709_contig00082-0013 [Vibrio harveyi]|uniref:hypothetical protein n=1 Tax=Vibrio harveyi TaxID=669 RepID=UPI0009385790|nr:hypothetical protein [Vibrio harveyi]EHD1698321.1 hypothetical protein [Vibrio vulnificus]APP09060.1 hypothetical protein BG259_27590 [Vibrio harveyi]GBL01875.1 hypothetical protein VH1709_contig00082-0013 [Vibrio harveyi]GEA25456.1 hypothetical protein VH1807_contig00128-0001 [Vibrio harveyi]HDM8057006.1 hypothetical protein [Vibrio harveyi]